jgi:hypothetical protein
VVTNHAVSTESTRHQVPESIRISCAIAGELPSWAVDSAVFSFRCRKCLRSTSVQQIRATPTVPKICSSLWRPDTKQTSDPQRSHSPSEWEDLAEPTSLRASHFMMTTSVRVSPWRLSRKPILAGNNARMCDFWATPTNRFDASRRREIDESQVRDGTWLGL